MPPGSLSSTLIRPKSASAKGGPHSPLCGEAVLQADDARCPRVRLDQPTPASRGSGFTHLDFAFTGLGCGGEGLRVVRSARVWGAWPRHLISGDRQNCFAPQGAWRPLFTIESPMLPSGSGPPCGRRAVTVGTRPDAVRTVGSVRARERPPPGCQAFPQTPLAWKGPAFVSSVPHHRTSRASHPLPKPAWQKDALG